MTPGKRVWVIIGVLYVISYGLSLLSLDAIYWDDWTLVSVPPSAVLEQFRQAGALLNFTGYLHYALLQAGPWAYHILDFVLVLLTGVLLWAILGTIPVIRPVNRSLIVALFVLLPLNAARIAIINFPVTVFVFMFFLAWYLLVARRGWPARMCALALFFMSFGLSSLLLFYLLPLAHALYLGAWRGDNRASTVLVFGPFAALPLVEWAIKLRFFRPYGGYANYNTIDLTYLRGDLPWLLAGFAYSAVVVAVLNRVRSGRLKALVLIPAGLWVLWLGIVPYRAVGYSRFPTWNPHDWYDLSFFNWDARHQVLMPLGAAIAIVALDRMLRIKNAPWVAALIIAVSVAYNVHVGLEYRLDWIKQQEMIRLFAASDEVRRAKTIIMYDPTYYRFNARRRTMRYYEYNGMLKRAFGDETRFAMDLAAWARPLTDRMPASYAPQFNESNSASHYTAGVPDIQVNILETSGKRAILLAGRGGFALRVIPLVSK
jgi:hypothetical protein